MSKAQFDSYSANYEVALGRGLGVSGENSIYFAEGRLRWLSQCLASRQLVAKRVLDFGCGVGNSLPLLRDLLGASHVAGVDVSHESIEMARQRFPNAGFQLGTVEQLSGAGNFDLAFCNGVFHHIPVEQRAASARYVWEQVRPGGVFAFFENNPLNPGTRYVMSRIPFDQDAITLLPWNARSLLRQAGFTILQTNYLFYFPKLLSALRPLEPWLCRLPLGAQYLILCQRDS
ncbi:MAG: methyltransferase domain-containing protein [Pirellulaceae bacterium]|nr:methyltransferase domain-containing protein [Pirellulaceae bacterium]